jgi:ribose transport system permease protein
MKNASKSEVKVQKSNFNIGRVLRSYGIMIVLVLIIIPVSIISESFFSIENMLNIIRQVAVVGIIAFGMTLVIIAGSIDLSVGAVVSFSGVVCISIVNNTGSDTLAIMLALAAGAAVGLINGLIISGIKGKVGEAFIITYGMQMAVAAIALIYSGGNFMTGKTEGFHSILGKGFGPIIVFVALAIVMHYMLTKTRFGRVVYFIGGNNAATKMSGINVRNHTIVIFMIAGILAALASIVLSSRVNAASPMSGKGYELDAIAAVVVGGTSMRGGKGGIINTVLGVIVIGVVGNALNIMNVTSYPQMIIKGMIIILAVTLDVWNERVEKGVLVK